MIKQTPGKIFLSDQRGIIETERSRSYCTFNFDKFFNEHKNRFGNLYLLNEETLKGNEGFDIKIEETSYVIIIPY
jgi:quercetin 2,3-dioxygenase